MSDTTLEEVVADMVDTVIQDAVRDLTLLSLVRYADARLDWCRKVAILIIDQVNEMLSLRGYRLSLDSEEFARAIDQSLMARLSPQRRKAATR